MKEENELIGSNQEEDELEAASAMADDGGKEGGEEEKALQEKNDQKHVEEAREAAAAAAAGERAVAYPVAFNSSENEKDHNTVSTENENENDNDIAVENGGSAVGDDEDGHGFYDIIDEETVLHQTPLFHYTRITGSGLPRQHQQQKGTSSSSSTSRCTCSQLSVIKIDPETLMVNNSAAASAAFASTHNNNNNNPAHRETRNSGHTSSSVTASSNVRRGGRGDVSAEINNGLLLSSDLWAQPHLVLACGWQMNNSITLTHVHPNNANINVNIAGGETGSNSNNSSNVGTPVAVVDGNKSHYHQLGGGGGVGGGGGGGGGGNIPININNVMTLGAGATVGGASSSASSTTAGSVAAANNVAGSSKDSPLATLKLYVREKTGEGGSHTSTLPPYSVVDLSYDASGTILGAIDEGAACTVWEFKYSTTLQPKSLLLPEVAESTGRRSDQDPSAALSPSSVSSQNTGNNPNVFSNFMSALTGMPPTASDSVVESSSPSRSGNRATAQSTSDALSSIPSNSSDNANEMRPSSNPQHHYRESGNGMAPALTANVVNVTRVNYPTSWGAPSCMVLDPSYKKKRDKSVLVGFKSGKLVLTKRGTFFQRRNDTVVYQANNSSAKNDGGGYLGIETIVWRGSLIAWADAHGIKLLDMDTMTRIAHIDRPTGARPSLYPTIRDLRPSLFFETSSSLLVAWGDCLMEMTIREHPVGGATGNIGLADGNEVKKRRTVECSMAWELDCVACDVVPLDAKHVAVLGLLPTEEYEEFPTSIAETSEVSRRNNDLEVQVVSREDGTILYSDCLPIIRSSDDVSSEKIDEGMPSGGRITVDDSASSYRLMSTFALPRMDDVEETKAMRSEHGNANAVVGLDVEFDLNQGIFSGSDSSTLNPRFFKDPHLRWSIRSTVDDDVSDDGLHDASSVDSDDYEFITRPVSNKVIDTDSKRVVAQTSNSNNTPPTMIVCSSSDVVLSRVCTIDDSIQHALTMQKFALALRRGLLYRKQLRRFNLEDLINYYLEAVLKIGKNDQSSLSLRRMKLALDAMPVLFGDNIALWEKWTRQLESIPGSLFLLQKNIPVRDPVLPPMIYSRVLLKMIADFDHVSTNSKGGKSMSADGTDHVASSCFLDSITAWGSTNVLREFIKLYRASRERYDSNFTMMRLREGEISLQRRYLQTSAGYLNFPLRSDIGESLLASPPNDEANDDGSQDLLFDASTIIASIAPLVPLVAISEDADDGSESAMDIRSHEYSLSPNNQICLEAMARLRMIQGRHDLALKCFLAIGAFHSADQLETFEKAAIDMVNGSGYVTQRESPIFIEARSYDYILDLIGTHHLHQFLLEKDFLLSTDSKLFVPIIALLRLVGLKRLGDFLIEHCVSPDYSYDFTLSEDSGATKGWKIGSGSRDILRREPLPIDKVAEQLEGSPALLHWYLHLVLTRRPETYVKFPTNSVPAISVTNLHRKHFQLYVDFAGDFRDSRAFLSGIEPYKVETQSTPLLAFLRASLKLGGILPVDARRVLEIERSKSSDDNIVEEEEISRNSNENSTSSDTSSPIFALELAYLIEYYSEQTQAEAMGILDLYLRGIQSVVLAVFFVQRQKRFDSELWDALTSFCINDEYSQSEGLLFGDLLEAGALAGADLARLVKKIPEGINVEGLRPRLVAAVADYRMKVEEYTAAISAGSEDQITLMREIAHRSRRGARYLVGLNRQKTPAELLQLKRQEDEGEIAEKIIEAVPTAMPRSVKTRTRQDHHKLVFTIPRR